MTQLIENINNQIVDIMKTDSTLKYKLNDLNKVMESIMSKDIQFQDKVFEIIEKYIKYDSSCIDVVHFYDRYQVYFFNRV